MTQVQEKPTEKRLMIPMMQRAAETRPSSYQEEDDSIEVVWSTGASVTRFDWWDGEYYDETLSLDDGAVRLDRLNNGAPFLRDHRQSISSVIGSVVRGSARIEDGQGIARVRLANTADVADDVQKIRDGHVTTVSVGYAVHEYQVREATQGARKVMHAIDWEPYEVSAVTIPADPDARIRSADARQGGFPCIVRGLGAASPIEEEIMTTANAPAPEATPPQPAPAPEAQRANPAHVTAARILELCEAGGLGNDVAVELVRTNETTPMTADQLSDKLAVKYAEARAKPAPDGAITITADEQDKYRAALTGAFHVRITNSMEKPADGGEVFGHMSSREIARAYLERSGVRAAHMGPHELFGQALGIRSGGMTTSDFAIALQNAGNLSIMQAYEQAEQTWRPLVKEVSAPDFRPVPLVGLTGTPEFLVVEENGEYSYGSFQDIGDSYKLWTAGKIISLSRQLLINDQLGLFGDMAGKLGAGAALHEANSVWALILGNPTLSDNVALFHATHGNLGTAAAITVASLGAARAAMRKQVDRDGVTPINIVPKYLIVGPDKETEALQVLTTITPNQVGQVVPAYITSLTLIVEPRLTGNQWYLAADPVRAAALIASYLQGQRGIYTDTRVGFEVDGVEYKGRLDFGAKAQDYRGLYKNPGA